MYRAHIYPFVDTHAMCAEWSHLSASAIAINQQRRVNSGKTMRNMEYCKLFLVRDHTKYTFFSCSTLLRANNQIKPTIHPMFYASKYDLLYLSTVFSVDSFRLFFLFIYFSYCRGCCDFIIYRLWYGHVFFSLSPFPYVNTHTHIHINSHGESFGSIIYRLFYWWHLFVGFGEYCHTQNKINMGLCLTTWIRARETKINEIERENGENIHRVIRIHIMMDIRVKCKRPCYCDDICFFFPWSGCPGLISRYFGGVSISLVFFSFR